MSSLKNPKIAQAQQQEDAYNRVPYESYVYPHTHPDHLHVIASLFNLSPPPLSACRVLEIGCASGGNLIPFALAYPEAVCVGIDISGEQINTALQQRDALDIRNIDFIRQDIMKAGEDLKKHGPFDYIICHGVLSWVPEPVRNEIFRLCGAHLSTNGLALISYNTLPGWSAVKSLREMMIYHTKNFKDPAQKIHEAKSLLNFLYNNAPGADNAYKKIIDEERSILGKTNDSYLFHDHLEAENHQFYLHEFANMLQAHGLSYVGDTTLSTMYIGNFNQKVRETLAQIKDVVRQEQYIDFLTNRRFRHSIITRTDNTKTLSRSITLDVALKFYWRAEYESVPDPEEGVSTSFRGKGGNQTFSTQDVATISMLRTLLSFGNNPVAPDTLIAALMKEQKTPDKHTITEILLKNILPFALRRLISLHKGSAAFVQSVSAQPRASRLARLQAATPGVHRVTTMLRETAPVDLFSKTLLPFLDGTRDMKTLLKEMSAQIKKDNLTIRHEGELVTESPEQKKILEKLLKNTLEKMAASALLEA
ncbi:MAG: class I SAM-dependent methyltransferase [Alphaproteobacteria bacterium]|nr:class I SAM-dependent methyltransferase [Alphaproteobacteria bacterium]